MAADPIEDFANQLSERYRLHFDAALDRSRTGAEESRLRRVWETSFLNSHDFADEVATFARLARASHAELKQGEPLVGKFSRRFLRQTFVFPFADGEGRAWLAVADPWDQATTRAAELALGRPVSLVVAAYDDIALLLRETLEEEPERADAVVAARADDIENLRDLASGAPVVRAVNDLIEKAIDMRASDIHVEPFRSGLVVRMRIDGMLRIVPAPTLIVPEAIISRIKILASLDIAERRLPQDGAARVRIGTARRRLSVSCRATGACSTSRSSGFRLATSARCRRFSACLMVWSPSRGRPAAARPRRSPRCSRFSTIPAARF
jgi:general secretion pathway protein E